jgi:uncharacterized protein with PQ loop repeat
MDPSSSVPTAFALLGTISSFSLAISPVPVVIQIFRSRSVGSFLPDFFIIGTIYGFVNGTYTIVTNQTVALVSNCISIIFYLFYLVVYSIYAPMESRVAIWRKFGLWFSLAALITGMGPSIFGLLSLSPAGADWMDSRGGRASIVATWLGVCSAVSITALFSGQLTNIVSVIRNRDSSSISIWMALGGLFCSISWTVYSVLILDWFYIISNLIGDIAGLVQVALKIKYRKNDREMDVKGEIEIA